MIYFLLYAVSLTLLGISLSFQGYKRKIFLSFSVLFPCLLAGLRDVSVGTDMRVYIVRFFDVAVKSKTFLSYIKLIGLNDYLYLVVNYLVSRFTDLLWIELFIQQALVIIPIYCALFRIFDNRHNILLGALLYFLVMYNVTFNLSRQSIALAFEILGFSYLGKNNKKLLFCFLISVLFHNTAIISIIPFCIYWVFNLKWVSTKFKFFLSSCLCAGSVLFVYFLKTILTMLSNSNITMIQRIAGYTRYLREEVDFSIAGVLFCLVCVVPVIVYKRKITGFCYDSNYFLVLALLGSVLYQAGGIINFSQRASYYFLYPVIFIALPSIVSDVNGIRRILHPQRWILFFFISWWIYNFYILNIHETIPYVFFFD